MFTSNHFTDWEFSVANCSTIQGTMALAPSSIQSFKSPRGKVSFGSGFIKIHLSKIACCVWKILSQTPGLPLPNGFGCGRSYGSPFANPIIPGQNENDNKKGTQLKSLEEVKMVLFSLDIAVRFDV
jgi:hypothetical protein